MVKNSIVAAALIAVPVLSLAQDAQKGKTVFNVSGLPRDRSRCAKQDWPRTQRARRRKAGTVPNFDYSDANKSSGIVWNEATFEDYIKNPATKVPDAKMVFPGIKNEQQVKDLWAYVSQFDANGNIKK